MLTCDYCRDRINENTGLVSVMTPRRTLHLHAERNPDCVDRFMDVAKDTRGDRPPAPAG